MFGTSLLQLKMPAGSERKEPFFGIIRPMKKLTLFFSAIAFAFLAVCATNEVKAAKSSTRPARITAKKSFYDGKGGFLKFEENVYVDDERYQIHADNAYVSLASSNQLHRIVAFGSVAMTNESRRAYGTKVTYNRPTGTVVLTGTPESPATIIDEAKGEGKHQIVKGIKIRFWIGAEQIEVLEADITTPTSGMGDVKSALGAAR